MGRPISTLVLGDDENSDQDLTLLTLEETYAAVGIEQDSTGTNDAAMLALGSVVSEAIVGYCKWRQAEDSMPTLRMQNLIETFHGINPAAPTLTLARRPVQEIAAVEIDGDTLDDTEYFVERNAGVLRRVERHHWRWQRSAIVVYTAGFDIVPTAVKWAASAIAKDLYAKVTSQRDPTVRSVRTEGVGEVGYQIDSVAVLDARPLIPAFIGSLLAPYVNAVV